MISHNPKFIFVHVAKAAGSSIEAALQQYSVVPVSFEGNGNAILNGKHMSAGEIMAAIGPLWDQYFSFAVIRNPWERVVSNFIYLQKINHHMTKGAKTPHEWIMGNHVWCYPAAHYVVVNGEIAVDYLIRFEKLQEGFNGVCERLGIEPIRLLHNNKSVYKNYADYYDEESIRVVAHLFKDDIRFFNYQFGS